MASLRISVVRRPAKPPSRSRVLQLEANSLLEHGKFAEALTKYEQALVFVRNADGARSEEAVKVCETVTLKVLEALKSTYTVPEPALVLGFLFQLLKMLSLCDQCATASALCPTYNALAGAYRRLGNFEMAKQWDFKALIIARELPKEKVSLARLYHSMSITLGKMRKFSKALKFAEKAVQYANEELQTSTTDRDEKLTLLSVSCHNAAVQAEHLKQASVAFDWHCKAAEVLSSSQSPQHARLHRDALRAMNEASQSQSPRLDEETWGDKSRSLKFESEISLSNNVQQGLPTLRGKELASPRVRKSNNYWISTIKRRNQRKSPDVYSSLATSSSSPRFLQSPLPTARSRLEGSPDLTHENTVELNLPPSCFYSLKSKGESLKQLLRMSERSTTFGLSGQHQCDEEGKELGYDWYEEGEKERVSRELLVQERKYEFPVSVITLIQAFVRGVLARIKFRLRKKYADTRTAWLYRRGTRLAGGTYAVVCVCDRTAVFEVVVAREGQSMRASVEKTQELAAQDVSRILQLSGIVQTYEGPLCTSIEQALSQVIPHEAEHSATKFSKHNDSSIHCQQAASDPAHAERLKARLVMEAAAITVQKHFRRYLVQRDCGLRKPRPRRLIYRCFKSFEEKGVCAVVVFWDQNEVEVELWRDTDARKWIVRLTAQEMCDNDISPTAPHDLISRFTLTNLHVSFSPSLQRQQIAALRIQTLIRGFLTRLHVCDLERQRQHKLQFLGPKVVEAEIVYVALYEFSEKVLVETFKKLVSRQLKYRSHFYAFTKEEVREVYKRWPSWKELFEDILLKSDSISIRTQIEGNMCMQMTSSLLRLTEVLHSDPAPSHSFVLRTSHLFEHQMWVITISLSDDSSTLRFSAFTSGHQKPLQVEISLKQLAEVVKIPEKNIFSIGTVTVQRLLNVTNGRLWIDLTASVPDLSSIVTLMQAYVRGFLVRRRLRGKIRKGSLVTCQVVTLQDQQWTLYAYREVANIHIVGMKARAREKAEVLVPGTVFLKFPPSLSVKRILESIIFSKVVLSETEAPKQGQYYVLKRVSEKFKRSTELLSHSLISHYLADSLLSPSSRPLVAKIIVSRRPLELGGSLYLASVIKAKNVAVVELQQDASGETVRRILDVAMLGDPRDEEIVCEELLRRVELLENEHGELEIRIRLVEEVLYRKSCYISSKLFFVTIYRSDPGAKLEAFDPVTKATLKLEVPVYFDDPDRRQFRTLLRNVEVASRDGIESLIFTNYGL